MQWKQRIFSQKLELVQELKLLSERVLIAGRKASRLKKATSESNVGFVRKADARKKGISRRMLKHE